MRTTLTLEDDVRDLLERRMAERGIAFKTLVNEALRVGLARLDEPPGPRGYRTPAVSLGACFLPSLDDVGEALAFAEGEGAR